MITLRERIKTHLLAHPGLSASQIARAIDDDPQNVHETLRRMRDKDEVIRQWDGGGPHGGSTWRLK